jgi:branched-chain amino acid transport system permease protein
MRQRFDALRNSRHANLIIAVIVFGVAIFVPYFFDPLASFMNNAVLALAYVVMALGLNIVVGFAGLLDLGYVAFFAIGAHVAAYFGSAFWANAADGSGVALFVGEPAASMAGIHLNFLIVLVLAIIATTTGCRRCACAAT